MTQGHAAAPLEPFEATWTAVPDSAASARHAVMRYLRAADTSDPPLSDVGLAVSEAVTNAVYHAYVGDEPGPVRVHVALSSDELALTVEDDGGGMVPRPDSPGLGLGLPLIATVAERLDTQSTPGAGTKLCMWFRLDPDSATLPE